MPFNRLSLLDQHAAMLKKIVQNWALSLLQPQQFPEKSSEFDMYFWLLCPEVTSLHVFAFGASAGVVGHKFDRTIMIR